jgi:hypothetical protein
MSTILDALERSEQERQSIAGESSGKSYAIDIKYNQRNRFAPALLGLLIVIFSALVWWFAFGVHGSNIPVKIQSPNNTVLPKSIEIQESVAPASSLPQATPETIKASAPQPKAIHEITKSNHESDTDPITKSISNHKSSPNRNAEKLGNKQADPPLHAPPIADTSKITQDESETSSATANSKLVNTERVDPLKDIPVLNITGYIRNDQNVSMVIINNQLAREGDEISKGLRVIKILNDSVIFSYKGYVFSR